VTPTAETPAVPERGTESAHRPVGHREVDAALSLLRDVAALECADQIAVYGDVHQSLQRILRTIDAA
jgi:hypothetical protein